MVCAKGTADPEERELPLGEVFAGSFQWRTGGGDVK